MYLSKSIYLVSQTEGGVGRENNERTGRADKGDSAEVGERVSVCACGFREKEIEKEKERLDRQSRAIL